MAKNTTRCAFAAIPQPHGKSPAYIIGRADEGVPGYSALAIGFDDYESAQNHANLLNEDLGLSTQEAARIVASTMRRS